VRFRVLGGLEVVGDRGRVDTLSPKQRALLAVLLLDVDRVVSVDRLLGALWDDESETAIASLHSQVSRLRNALEPDRRPREPARVLLTQPPGYRLAASRHDVDAHRFVDEVAIGLRALEDDHPSHAAATLAAALASWSGPLLPEFADEPFVIAHAERVEQARLTALEGAADAQLRLGNPAESIRLLEGEAADRPARERMQWLLALALYRCERQTDALRVVDRCRRALVDSSGLRLGPDLQRLEVGILEHDPALTGDAPATRPAHAAPTAEAEATPEPDAPDPGGPAAGERPDGPASLVGRTQELAVLANGLDAAIRGRGGFALITGEPGIGKTRLSESLTAIAAERGVVTACARCPEHRSAPPFWPLTQLGEQLRAAGFTDLQVRELDRGSITAPTERFGFSRAVLDAVSRIGQPLLLVIDDLQWADPDSLRIIEHTAHELRSTQTFVVATVRPVPDHENPALVDCLAEIARGADAVHIVLGGLRADEVVTWLGNRSDVDVSAEVAALVHRRTAGNPLFIKELVELLASEGRLGTIDMARAERAIPPGVKAVVRRRVSRLPKATQQLLPVAASLGRAIDVESLAAAVDSNVVDVLDELEPAIDLGLLVELGGQLAFSHVLVADALADEVNAVRRAAYHARTARAMAATAGPGFGLRAAEVARHAYEGILAGTGELAIQASTIAAKQSAEQFAHEDAAVHWARVADAITRSRPADIAARIDVLIAQAEAMLAADMVGAVKAPIIAAVDAAAAIGSVADMARAALLANHEHVWANEPYGVVDDEIVRALERTLQLLPDDDVDTRALLLGALAAELVFAGPTRHRDVCASAVREACRAGRASTLAAVLNSVTVPCRPFDIEIRRRNAEEILALAESEQLDADQIFAAHYHLAETHAEMGDLAAAEAELAAARRTIEFVSSLRLRSQLYGFEGALAFARGRYDDADQLIRDSHELHRRGRRYDTEALELAYLAAVALEHGGVEDLIPVAQDVASSSPYGRTVAETIAFSVLEIGRHDVAAELVAPFGRATPFPDDYMTLACMSAAVHVRVDLGDVSAAAAIADLLRPAARRWASAGTTPFSMGPTDLALARCAAATGDDDEARRRFAAAVDLAEAAGAEPWLARTLAHQARFLTAIGDDEAGEAALDRAAELARRYGLVYVQRRIGQTVS